MGLFRPLLTKQERQTLTREERRELRQSRRHKRRESRPDVRLDVPKLLELGEGLILDMVAAQLPPEEKMGEVLDSLAEHADDVLMWTWAGPLLAGPLELLDGAAIRLVIRVAARPHLQKLYDKLRSDGRLEATDAE